MRAGLATLPDDSVQCCVTSPPYWGLRDYGVDGQLGLEATPAEFVERMVAVFAEVRRVLRPDGVLWLNIGDSYAGAANGSQGTNGVMATRSVSIEGRNQVMAKRGGVLKPKDLVGIPWRLAFALQADGWWLRSECIWHKPNPMPESITDRPTKSHEQVFLLTKAERYAYDADAVAESSLRAGDPNKGDRHVGDGYVSGGWLAGGVVPDRRNLRTVWTIATQPYGGAHFATFPEALAERCILSGSAPGTTVLDPFTGSGTTGAVALAHGRSFIGCELNPEYVNLARKRIKDSRPLFAAAEESSGEA